MGNPSLEKAVTGSSARDSAAKEEGICNLGREEARQSSGSGGASCCHVPNGLFGSPESVNAAQHQGVEGTSSISVGMSEGNPAVPETKNKKWNVPHDVQLVQSSGNRFMTMQSTVSGMDHRISDSTLPVANIPSNRAAGCKQQHLAQSSAPLLPTQLVSRRGPMSKTSPYRGVSCYKRTGRWEAHIWHAGRQVHLGTYSTPAEAARVYDMAAIKLRGWGADLNFGLNIYKNDPELQDLLQENGSTPEEIDVVKLVQGLKRRKVPSFPAVVKADSVSNVETSPSSAGGHSCEGEHTRSGLVAVNVMDVPTSPTCAAYGKHTLDTKATKDMSYTAQHAGNPVRIYVDGSPTLLGSPLIVGKDGHGIGSHNFLGQKPLTSSESYIPAAAAQSPGVSFVLSQESPLYEKPVLLGSAPVAHSRVISGGSYISAHPSRLHATLHNHGEVKRPFIWSPTLPSSPHVNVVVEKSGACAGGFVFEGKPLSETRNTASPVIPAYWQNVQKGHDLDRVEPILGAPHVSLRAHGDGWQRSSLNKHMEAAGAPLCHAGPLNGPLQSLRSVLRLAAQSHQTHFSGKLAALGPLQDHLGSSSESHETGSLASDSQARFAKLIQLIHELPAKHLVRPASENDVDGNNTHNHQEGTGAEAGAGKGSHHKTFEGEQGLLSGYAHRSAFKLWASSVSDKLRTFDEGHHPQQDRGSEQSTGGASGINNAEASNHCESCSAEGPHGNDAKLAIDTVIEETDEVTPTSTSGSAPSGSFGSGTGNNQIMEDDLLAAQELCKMSKMRGSGCTNSTLGFGHKKRKRVCSSREVCPTQEFPSWKRKKQRSASSRDARRGGTVLHRKQAPITDGNKVLAMSGMANVQNMIRISPSAANV